MPERPVYTDCRHSCSSDVTTAINTARPIGKSYMKTWLTIPFILAFTTNAVLASDRLSGIIIMLHNASNNFEQSVNHESIVDSLYDQIRPRAKITNNKLSTEEIDERVRMYVTEKYAPALIGNYTHLYSKLKSEKKNFSSCDDIEPINADNDVLVSLCVKQHENIVRVQYMTNGFGRGWSKSVVFIFKPNKNTLLLSAIELQLKEGVKTHVEGI